MSSDPLARLLDERAIDALRFTFAHSLTQGVEEFASLFDDDAQWENAHADIKFNGAREIVTGILALRAQWTSFVQVEHGGQTTIDGATATGWSYSTHSARGPRGGLPLVTIGYSDDVFVKRDGRWLFKRRSFVAIEGGTQIAEGVHPTQPSVSPVHTVVTSPGDRRIPSPFEWQGQTSSP